MRIDPVQYKIQITNKLRHLNYKINQTQILMVLIIIRCYFHYSHYDYIVDVTVVLNHFV